MLELIKILYFIESKIFSERSKINLLEKIKDIIGSLCAASSPPPPPPPSPKLADLWALSWRRWATCSEAVGLRNGMEFHLPEPRPPTPDGYDLMVKNSLSYDLMSSTVFESLFALVPRNLSEVSLFLPEPRRKLIYWTILNIKWWCVNITVLRHLSFKSSNI